MKKNFNRILSLVLVLMMVLSLAPVSALAEADVEELVSEPAPVVEELVGEVPAPVVEEVVSEEPAPVVEEVVSEEPAPVVEEVVSEEPAPVVEEVVSEEPAPVVEEPAAVEESDEEAGALADDEYPMQSFNYRADAGTEITVDAPEGAFPEDTQMVVTEMNLAEVQKLVDADAAVDGNVIAAADISFYHNGEKIQPKVPVYVSYASAAAAQAVDPQVVHISDAAAVEVIENVESAVTFSAEPMQMMAMSGLGAAEAPAASNEMVKLSFAANSFSVYAIIWKDESGAEQSATIHWMNIDGTELDSDKVPALDTTAASIGIANTFDGLSFTGQVGYVGPESEDEIRIATTLYKAEHGWEYERLTGADDAETQRFPVENGSNIYVYYQAPVSYPSGAADDTIASPTTTKSVTANEDGTYTIQLDVTGSTVEETDAVGANVLILLDRTSSMSSRMSGGGNRMQAAKAAVNTLVGILTGGEHPGVINYALLDFYVDVDGYSDWYWWYNGNVDRLHSWDPSSGAHQNSGSNYWTTNASPFNSYIQANSYNYATGTFGTATNWQSPLNSALTILNTRNTNNETYVIFVTDGEPNCYGIDTVTSGNAQEMARANAAAVQAIAALPKVSLYGVYCGSSGYNTLNNTIMNNGGKQTINGSDETALNNAFANIAHTIVDNLGSTDVTVDDGVPSLSSVSASVSGEASGYEYFIKGPEDSDFTTWTSAPGASYSEDNGVTWDLSSVGTVMAGTTYRIKFKVWPSQEAYDYIADLNNNKVDPVPDEKTLEGMGIRKNAQGVYYLVTNTHLNTTYKFKGTQYSDEPDKLELDEMILPTTKINVKKIWNNELDPRTAEDVTLTVTKDGASYVDVPMGEPTSTGAHTWEQTPTKDIYISFGQMTLDTATNKIEVISSGHDYTVIEPESFSYRWDLTSDVYHPMMINGTQTVLILVKDEDAPAALKTLADNMKATDGGKDYYKFGNKLYVAQSGSNVLTATNDRRSNLNLTKAVDGVAADGQLFEFTLNFTFPASAIDANDPNVWFSVAESADSETLVQDITTTATAAMEAGSKTGYYYAPIGSDFKVSLQKGWNLRVVNLPNGATYTITETADQSFEVTAIAAVDRDQADVTTGDDAAVTVDKAARKATGKIVKSNDSYTVTFTNKQLYFYVYHSNNNTIEKFSMADYASKTFDITAEVDSGFLYGGYYTKYNKAGSDYVGGMTATAAADGRTKDANGKPYNGGAGWWTKKNAYTVSGKTITPVAGTTYFLKEVPESYLTPYMHLIYDTHSNPINKIVHGYLISNLDDANYNDYGLYKINKTSGNKTKFTGSFVIADYIGTTKTTITAKTIAPTCGGGYVAVWQDDKLVTEGEGFVYCPYFKTPDQVEVAGIITRTVKTGNYTVNEGENPLTNTTGGGIYYTQAATVPAEP